MRRLFKRPSSMCVRRRKEQKPESNTARGFEFYLPSSSSLLVGKSSPGLYNLYRHHVPHNYIQSHYLTHPRSTISVYLSLSRIASHYPPPQNIISFSFAVAELREERERSPSTTRGNSIFIIARIYSVIFAIASLSIDKRSRLSAGFITGNGAI